MGWPCRWFWAAAEIHQSDSNPILRRDRKEDISSWGGRAPRAAWKNCHAHKQADSDGGLQRFCGPDILETVISGTVRAVQLNTVE